MGQVVKQVMEQGAGIITRRSARLSGWVDRMVWVGGGSEQARAVYPDIYPVMGIQSVGQVSQVVGEVERPLAAAGLTGLHRELKWFRSSADCSTVLVYFRPEALFAWRIGDPRELVGTSYSLFDLGVGDWERERFGDARLSAEPERFLDLVEDLLWRQLKDRELDPWAEWMVDRIVYSGGSVRIEQLAEEAVLSRRQLERKFGERIGLAPKAFSQLVRFRRSMGTLAGEGRLAELAVEGDYYDQAHWVKDFKRHAGMTPGMVRRRLE